MTAEAGIAKGEYSCSVLFDLRKLYENICLDELAIRCTKHDFPLAIPRLRIHAYRCGRFLYLGGWLDGPYLCRKGVVAGCSMATTFIRVDCQDGYDSLPMRPHLDLDVYVDDQGITCTGPHSVVLRSIVEGGGKGAPQCGFVVCWVLLRHRQNGGCGLFEGNWSRGFGRPLPPRRYLHLQRCQLRCRLHGLPRAQGSRAFCETEAPHFLGLEGFQET